MRIAWSATLGEENTAVGRGGWGKGERRGKRQERWLYCTFLDCNWCEVSSPAFCSMLL